MNIIRTKVTNPVLNSHDRLTNVNDSCFNNHPEKSDDFEGIGPKQFEFNNPIARNAQGGGHPNQQAMACAYITPTTSINCTPSVLFSKSKAAKHIMKLLASGAQVVE